jgi:hypothetical protein
VILVAVRRGQSGRASRVLALLLLLAGVVLTFVALVN